MTLTLIEKYKIIDEKPPKIKVEGELSLKEKQLLVSFFVLDELIDYQDKKTLHTLCASIHEQDSWIQCYCIDDLLKPVFRINKASTGNYYLHRITSRTEHAPNCLFKERQYDNPKELEVAQKPPIKKDAPFNLLGKKSKGLTKPSKDDLEKKQGGGASISKLARVLFHLLETAKLNVLSPANTLKPQEALLTGAKSLELRTGLPLSNYLELNPNRLKYRATLLKEDKAWGKDVEKHTLALLPVQSFGDNTLEVILPDKTIKPLNLATDIYQSSGRFAERTAPYMALVLISATAESPWFYQPTKAYVMPVYSKDSYFPVDSFYEREVMRHLYRLYFEALKKGHSFEIVKPIFGIEVPAINLEERVFVLPDFLIKKGGKTLVIEVNGSKESEYLERKARTHEHMKHLGELISFNAYEAEANNKLSQSISNLMNQVTGWLALH